MGISVVCWYAAAAIIGITPGRETAIGFQGHKCAVRGKHLKIIGATGARVVARSGLTFGFRTRAIGSAIHAVALVDVRAACVDSAAFVADGASTGVLAWRRFAGFFRAGAAGSTIHAYALVCVHTPGAVAFIPCWAADRRWGAGLGIRIPDGPACQADRLVVTGDVRHGTSVTVPDLRRPIAVRQCAQGCGQIGFTVS